MHSRQHLQTDLLGKVTRGRTHARRLHFVDEFLRLHYYPQWHCQAVRFADIGFGDRPSTTVAWYESARQHFANLTMIGSDIDQERVDGAQREVRDNLSFIKSDFADAQWQDSMHCLRAMNVLRQYSPEAVAPAQQKMGQALCHGGVLVEGTCSKKGEVGTFYLLEKCQTEVERTGLVMWTDFSQGFSPWLFRDRLPRDLRGHLHRMPALVEVFEAWNRASIRERECAPRICAASLFARSSAALLCRRDIRFGSVAGFGYLEWTPLARRELG